MWLYTNVYHNWPILNYPERENHNSSYYPYSSLIIMLSLKTLMPWYLLSESATSFLGYHPPYIWWREKILRNFLSISSSIPHNRLDHDFVSSKLLKYPLSRQLILWTGTIMKPTSTSLKILTQQSPPFCLYESPHSWTCKNTRKHTVYSTSCIYH